MVEIRDFENYYICENGEVISKFTGRPMCQCVDNTGYYQVILRKNGKKSYKRIHRILAEHFLYNENPNEFNMVNHIDGNKLNNSLDNLEWTNNKINTQHGYDNNLYKSNYRVPILVYHKNGEFYKEYKSIRSCCEDLKINRKTVSNILNGTKKTNNYNYIFRYKE